MSALALVILVTPGPASAKTDIRGVMTGAPLSEQLEQLELDGARCGTLDKGMPVSCSYDEGGEITLYVSRTAPMMVEKVVYEFVYTDADKLRARLASLYNLRQNRVEGEHEMDGGKTLLVSIGPDGKCRLMVEDDVLMKRDGSAGGTPAPAAR